MNDEAFLQAIAASPNDEGPRLIYADWLDERDDPRGTWLRTESALRGTSPKKAEHEALAARLEELRFGLDPGWQRWTEPTATQCSGPTTFAGSWWGPTRSAN